MNPQQLSSGSDGDPKYAKMDERIFVLHQHRNQGVSVARNLGKEKANCEFVTFVDADDCIKPDFLETMLRIQKKEGSDMLVCSYEMFRDAEREEILKSEKQEENPTTEVYDIETYFATYLLEGNTHCWGVLYHKKVLEEVMFPKGITIGEDLLFLIDAALKAENIAVTNYKGYWYYFNEKGAMMKKFTPSYMDQISCWEKASDKILCMYPKLKNKLNSILVVSSMLVVGKLSQLEKKEREAYGKELQDCLRIVEEYTYKKDVVKLLPKGYFLKCTLFRVMPGLYMNLYGKRG